MCSRPPTRLLRPVPPLVVLIHARGWQGWRATVPGRGCCHLLRPANLHPAVKLRGKELHKGRATCQVTAGWDEVNKEWKPILLRRLYFTETRGEVIGAATTMAEWFPVQMGNYYICKTLSQRPCPHLFSGSKIKISTNWHYTIFWTYISGYIQGSMSEVISKPRLSQSMIVNQRVSRCVFVLNAKMLYL